MTSVLKNDGESKMYIIKVKTDREMGSEGFVTRFLHDWYYHENELMRPEMYGMGEPIRYKIEERGIEAAIKAWLKNKMPVMLKRKSSPKFEVDMSWRPQRGLDPRLFPWDCIIWLNYKAGNKLAIEMFKFIITNLEPAFGYLTNEEDYKEKHYVEYKDRTGTTQKYIGREPGGKCLPHDVSATLPGIYWVTYFGTWAISEIGKSKFKNLNVHCIEDYQTGYLVTLYKDSSIIGTQEAKDIERDVINKLGREKFFDKSLVNLDELFKDQFK